MLVTSQTTPPAGYRLNAKQVLAIASRSPAVKAELRRHPHAVPYEYTKGYPGVAGQLVLRSEARAGADPGLRRRPDRQGHAGVDRLSGGLDDGARLPRRVRAQRQRLVHLDPALHRVRRAVHSLAPAADAVAPRSADAARVLDLAGVLQPRARSGSRFRSSTRSCSTCWRGCWRSGSARGSPASRCARSCRSRWLAVAVVFLMAFRIGLNVLNSNVIDVGYAGVIGADQADPRTAAVRPLAGRQRLRRHLRPGVLLLLRPVPADLRLERHLGLAAGRARGGDLLRREHARRPVSRSAAG